MANLNYNKVTLGGRLTADVEVKKTTSDIPVASFSLAINRKRDKEKTDFINCVAWRQTAEFIAKYFRKGSSIMLEGELQTRSWDDQSGQKRYATEVIVSDAYFVDSKGEGNVNVPNPQTAEFTLANDEEGLPF